MQRSVWKRIGKAHRGRRERAGEGMEHGEQKKKAGSMKGRRESA